MSGEKPLPVGVLISGADTPIATSEEYRAVKLHLPKTVCHQEGGCIRAFEDDTCGEQGQCSVVLVASEAYERGVRDAAKVLEAVSKTYLPGGPMDAKGGLLLGATAIRQLLEVKG
ncbi:MAG: hypothetical protein KIS86_06440 [Devosia sp.]|nr:hypothetical protein [Devosia sp.]